MADSVSQGLNK